MAKLLILVYAALTAGTSGAFVPSDQSKVGAERSFTALRAEKDFDFSPDQSSNRHGNRRDVLKSLPGRAAALSAIAFSAKNTYSPTPASAAETGDLSYLGPLADMVGTWSGSDGLSITGVPSRKSEPLDKGSFELLVRPYKEVITIEAIPEAVKQRGGSIEQFSGVVTYKKEVWATDDDPGLIHVEDGMLFYLDDVELYNGGMPGGKLAKDNRPPFSIARSATVPHGNSAFLFGNYQMSSGPPRIPDIDARPVPNDIVGYDSPYTRSPYSAVNPNKDLQKAIKGQKISKTTHISLDSRNRGAVTNTPFITSRADTRNFRADFWIESVKGNNGKVVKQLQYSEFVDIFFHKNKDGSDDDLINWPHVMINTLTKEV